MVELARLRTPSNELLARLRYRAARPWEIGDWLIAYMTRMSEPDRIHAAARWYELRYRVNEDCEREMKFFRGVFKDDVKAKRPPRIRLRDDQLLECSPRLAAADFVHSAAHRQLINLVERHAELDARGVDIDEKYIYVVEYEVCARFARDAAAGDLKRTSFDPDLEGIAEAFGGIGRQRGSAPERLGVRQPEIDRALTAARAAVGKGPLDPSQERGWRNNRPSPYTEVRHSRSPATASTSRTVSELDVAIVEWLTALSEVLDLDYRQRTLIGAMRHLVTAASSDDH